MVTKNLRNCNAPGIDGLKSIVLQNMPDSFIIVITNIFNWCLKNGYFPNCFKRAKGYSNPKTRKVCEITEKL